MLMRMGQALKYRKFEELGREFSIDRYQPERRFAVGGSGDTEHLLHVDTVASANNDYAPVLLVSCLEAEGGRLAGPIVSCMWQNQGDDTFHRFNVGLLQKAIENDPKLKDTVKKSSCFDKLRNDQDFKKLIN